MAGASASARVVSTDLWFDEGKPWAVLRVKAIRYNVEAGDHTRAKRT
jgi:hypothetical protein